MGNLKIDNIRLDFGYEKKSKEKLNDNYKKTIRFNKLKNN